MKSTEHFKQTIKAYLDKRASGDELFAVSYVKENKNIDDCCTYILNCVKESGCNGFSDEEIFGQAVHYYDEDNINVGKKIDCKVVVNHSIDLTETELAEAKSNALKRAEQEAYEKLLSKPKKAVKVEVEQPSLF